MAESRPVLHIQPWEGTGWPVELFKYKDNLIEKRQYFCARNACGKENNRILREPIQLDCGHRVCKACLDELCKIPAPERACDSCVDEFTIEERQNQLAAGGGRELMDVGGSQMETDPRPVWERIPQHAKIDPSRCATDRAAGKEIAMLEVVCPFQCGITEIDRRPLILKYLERHMSECPQRLQACSKCTEPVQFVNLAEHTRNDCLFRVVECPNGCGKRGLQGKDLAKHQAECEKKPPTCRLCNFPYSGSHHRHLITDCFGKCPFGCPDVNPGELIINHLEDPTKIRVHLLALHEMLEDVRRAMSDDTPSGVGGVTQQQRTALLDRLLQLECRSERAERHLTDQVNQLTGATAAALLDNAGRAAINKRELKEMESLFRVIAGDVHLLSSYETTFRHLTEKVGGSEKGYNDRLNKLEGLSNVRLAEIEDQKTLLDQFQMTSFNGKLVWRIDRVNSKRNESHIRHSIFSHPFYTEVYGYKMCARVYFNGDGSGKGSHISLFFVVMKGQFDALLSWPFQQKVTMALKNQTKKRADIVDKFRPDAGSTSFTRPKNEMNIASGSPLFATQELVFDPQNGFVVDDTMFIELSVDNSYDALHGLNVSVQESRGSSSSTSHK